MEIRQETLDGWQTFLNLPARPLYHGLKSICLICMRIECHGLPNCDKCGRKNNPDDAVWKWYFACSIKFYKEHKNYKVEDSYASLKDMLRQEFRKCWPISDPQTISEVQELARTTWDIPEFKFTSLVMR